MASPDEKAISDQYQEHGNDVGKLSVRESQSSHKNKPNNTTPWIIEYARPSVFRQLSCLSATGYHHSNGVVVVGRLAITDLSSVQT